MKPTSSRVSRNGLLAAALVIVGAATTYGIVVAFGFAAQGNELPPSPAPTSVTPAPTPTVPTPVLDEPVTVLLTTPAGETLSSVIPADVIRMAAQESGTVLDGRTLAAAIDERMLAVLKPAADARFRIVQDTVTVVPARYGLEVTPESLARDVNTVITETGTARTVQLTPERIAPTRTTHMLRNMGVNELVSSYTQKFPPAAYRTINIGTAAKYISGTLLMPGRIFSMNDTVKERTPENGYVEGWIIRDGVFAMEQGGAVSTITTAMYNAAWFAGLDLVEHRAHSIYIPRYPAGREATVSWGDFDMRFRNNLAHPIFITVQLHRSSVSVFFWGTREWQRIGTVFGRWTDQVPYRTIYNTDAECHDQDGIVGFRITTWRTFFRDDVEVRREAFRTHYAPSPHVICGPEPTAKPSARPTAHATLKPKPTPTPTATPTVSPSVTPTVPSPDTPTA